MKLPYWVVKEIVDLPEGKPASFTVHTDGKESWKLEKHKTEKTEEKDLLDLRQAFRNYTTK
jgi:hypothetical protein